MDSHVFDVRSHVSQSPPGWCQQNLANAQDGASRGHDVLHVLWAGRHACYDGIQVHYYWHGGPRIVPEEAVYDTNTKCTPSSSTRNRNHFRSRRPGSVVVAIACWPTIGASMPIVFALVTGRRPQTHRHLQDPEIPLLTKARHPVPILLLEASRSMHCARARVVVVGGREHARRPRTGHAARLAHVSTRPRACTICVCLCLCDCVSVCTPFSIIH